MKGRCWDPVPIRLNGGRIEMAIPRVVQKGVRLHAAILADKVRKCRLDAGGDEPLYL